MKKEIILQRLEDSMRTQVKKIMDEIPRYTPRYYIRMLDKLKALQTAEQLLSSEKQSEGFTKLLLYGRIDLTLEYLVVTDPDFCNLFQEDMIKIAKKRLGII